MAFPIKFLQQLMKPISDILGDGIVNVPAEMYVIFKVLQFRG